MSLMSRQNYTNLIHLYTRSLHFSPICLIIFHISEILGVMRCGNDPAVICSFKSRRAQWNFPYAMKNHVVVNNIFFQLPVDWKQLLAIGSRQAEDIANNLISKDLFILGGDFN